MPAVFFNKPPIPPPPFPPGIVDYQQQYNQQHQAGQMMSPYAVPYCYPHYQQAPWGFQHCPSPVHLQFDFQRQVG